MISDHYLKGGKNLAHIEELPTFLRIISLSGRLLSPFAIYSTNISLPHEVVLALFALQNHATLSLKMPSKHPNSTSETTVNSDSCSRLDFSSPAFIIRSSESSFTDSTYSNSKRPDNDSNSGMLNRYLYQTGGVAERLIQGKVMGRKEHVGRATRAIAGFKSVCERGN